MFAFLSAFATALPHAALAPTAGPNHPPVEVGTKPTVKLNPCWTVAPDAEATLTRGEASATVSSAGIAYGSSFRPCRRFVGEIEIPADARGPESGLGGSTKHYTVRPGLAQSPNQATCAATRLTMDAYLKAAGTNGFVLQSKSEYVGVWDAASYVPRCVLTLVEGSTPAPQREPNSAGRETWRVLVNASRGGLQLGVTARAAFDAIPY
jgi:hypothetical protein